MGGGGKGKSYVVGSACSGVLEIGIFHPVDTIGKRLMSNTEPIFGAAAEKAAANSGGKSGFAKLNQVLFRESASKGAMGKWKALYPGVGFGAVYKVLQRTYKFSAQPILKDYLAKNHKSVFTSAFGTKGGTDMMHATSGMMVGLGEVSLLPLDRLKIMAQVNQEALKGRGMFRIMADEGFVRMYRGWNWTAMRNMPGSFALFGATSVIYSWIFDTTKAEATGFQMFCGSLMGGTCSIAVSSPMDVIKTRIQNRPFDDPRSGMRLLTDLVREEGPSAFFKGMVPKLGLIGPKLVFSWTVAQWLSREIQAKWFAEELEGKT